MTTYAALTDGTTTVTFASPGTLGWYRIETGWAPKIAGLRQSALGGRGPYEDVTEEIPVSVGGSTAAHMYSNLSTLKVLIDQANRWYLGENVGAVLFRYSPEGATVSSAASPLQAATWNASLEFPAGWPGIPQSGSAVWGSGLTMRFARKGLWMYTAASASAAGSNGDVVTVALAASTSFYSPTKVTATNVIAGYQARPAFIAVGDAASSIVVVEAESLTLGTGWSSVSGSAQLARGGSVAQFNNSLEFSIVGTLPISASARNFAVYANVIQTSGSPCLIYAILSSGSSYQAYAQTNKVVAASSRRQWQFLGALNTTFPVDTITFNTNIISSGSITVLVDSLVVVDTDNANVISLSRNPTLVSSTQDTIRIDHRAASFVYPLIDTSNQYPYKWNGSAYLSTRAGSVYCLLMQNFGGSAGEANWRAASSSGALTLLTNTWTVERTTGYAVPA